MSFFSAEEQIEARLQSKCDARVYTAAELADIEESQQITPAVHIVYGGFRPTQEKGQGAVQEIEHTWYIVGAERTSIKMGSGKILRESVGPLLDQIINAMIGWRPDSEHKPFKMGTAPQPAYEAGFGYFPLSFTTRTQHRARP